MNERKKTAARQTTMVYCGPDIRGVAKQYQAFTGGLPQPLYEAKKTHPELEGLICTVEDFPAVRRAVETRGSAESILFRAVERRLSEQGGKRS